jgi:hypothetical protein
VNPAATLLVGLVLCDALAACASTQTETSPAGSTPTPRAAVEHAATDAARPESWFVYLRVCERCTFPTLTKVVVYRDASFEACNLQQDWFAGMATPAEMDAMDRILASAELCSKRRVSQEPARDRYEILRACGNQIVLSADGGEPALAHITDTLGPMTRRATRKPSTEPCSTGG